MMAGEEGFEPSASGHSVESGQADAKKPAEGDEHDRDAEDPVDRLERRLVAIADDRDFDRDPDEQTSPDDEGGGRRERMSEPDKASRDKRPESQDAEQDQPRH